MELNSSKAIILTPESSFVEVLIFSSSFCHVILIGESPLAIVHVKVILSPFCRLDVRREKGTIFGATIFVLQQQIIDH